MRQFQGFFFPPNPATPPLTSSAHLSFFNGKVLPKSREDEMEKNHGHVDRHGLVILEANDLPYQSLSIWNHPKLLVGGVQIPQR